MSKTETLSLTAAPRRVQLPEPQVAITPDDVRQARFASSVRGYDRAEVTAFLEEAADALAHAARENELLRTEIRQLEVSNTQFLALESNLKNTLMSAQKAADDMREKASSEAARILREAEERAESLLRKSEEQVEHFAREIDGLRLKRHDAARALESTISMLQQTLARVRSQEQTDQQRLALVE
jgi:cell division initiation protein